MATNKYENLQFIKKETLESMADAIRDKMPDKGEMTATEMVAAVQEYTTDASATGDKMLAGETAYVNNNKITGTIPTVSIPKPGIALNESNGVITATETLNTTGYYKAGNNSSTQQLPTQGDISIHPGHDAQTITKYTKKYLTGNILVDGSDDLHSENILANKTIFGVPGSHVCDQLPAGEVDRSITYDGKGTDIKANIKVVTQNGSAANMVGVATGDVSITKKASDLDSDLKAENIKMDEEIFGVHGTFTEVTNGTAVSASDIRKNKTAFVNGRQVNGTMPDTTLTASGTASATTTVAPGDITIAGKTESIDGKTRLTAAPTTDTDQIDTYYMAVGATAEANSTGTTSDISGEAKASIDTAGYISSGAKGNVTGTATAKTSKKSSSTYYIPIRSGECSVHGGSLSVTENYNETPTVDITLDGQTTSGVTITDDKPSSGYYLTVGATSSKLTGSTKVSRADITTVQSPGYIPYQASETVIASDSATPSVTVNKGTKTEYIKIPTASGSIGGSASSGKATANIDNVHSMNTVASPTGTAGTDYFTVKATATGTDGGYTPKYTVNTEGYIKNTVTGTEQTVYVDGDTKGESIHIPKAEVTVGGTASSGSATALINNVNSMNTVSSPAGTAGTDYFTVTATAYGTNGGFTPSMSVDTEGYLKSDAEGSYTTVQVESDITGQSIHIPKASISAYGSVDIENSVTPGSFDLNQVARPNVNGKQIISVGTPTTKTSEVTTDYYVAIRPSVAAGVNESSNTGSITASVNSAGYAPGDLCSPGNVSINSTLKSTAKTGDIFFLPIPGCEIRNDMSGFSSCYKLKSGYSGGSVIPIYLQVEEGGWLRKGDFWLYDSSIDVKYMDSQYTGLKPEYIRAGYTIFGVTGTYTGNDTFSTTLNATYNTMATGYVSGGILGAWVEDEYVATYQNYMPTDGMFNVKGVRAGSTRLVVRHYASGTSGTVTLSYFKINVTAL